MLPHVTGAAAWFIESHTPRCPLRRSRCLLDDEFRAASVDHDVRCAVSESVATVEKHLGLRPLPCNPDFFCMACTSAPFIRMTWPVQSG